MRRFSNGSRCSNIVHCRVNLEHLVETSDPASRENTEGILKRQKTPVASDFDFETKKSRVFNVPLTRDGSFSHYAWAHIELLFRYISSPSSS